MDTKQVARRLGLEESATEQQIESKASALSGFAADVIALTGAKGVDEALGVIRAGIEAIAQRDVLKEQVKAQEHASTQKEYRRTLKDAFKDGRMTLGEAAKVLPFLKDEESKKAEAALAAVTEQKRSNIVDALCAAEMSPKRLAQLQAYLERCAPKAALPEPAREPELSPSNAGKVQLVSEQQVAAFAQQSGLSNADPERVMALVGAETVTEAAKRVAALKK